MRKTILFYLLLVSAVTSFAQLAEKVGIGVRLGTDSLKGALVLAVIPGGPAESTGLKEGDFIIRVNDRLTKGLVMDSIVKLIVGEEGTEVKILAERKGVTKNYSIVRKKYKFANSFYQSSVKDDAFCSALTILMNDAPYNFKKTTDTSKLFEGKESNYHYYKSKIEIPGAQKVIVVRSSGNNLHIDLGNFSSIEKANQSGEAIINRIKTCYPAFYYKSFSENNGSTSIQAGTVYDNGFESAILDLISFYSESEKTYKLMLNVMGGAAKRYYKIMTAKEISSFSTSLRSLYNDIPNDHRNVKGILHEDPNGSWYEIKPVPEGATGCRLAKNGAGIENYCNCSFYLGDSRDDAVRIFNDLYEKTRVALGSEFVSSFETAKHNPSIPKNAESIAVFGAKKKRTAESLPLIALVIFKNDQNKFEVKMLFYKFGF